jgi:hypothetical protein
MKHLINIRVLSAIFSLFILLISSSPLSALPDDKLTPKDLIAKHLESIGTAEVRNGFTSRVVVGNCNLYFRPGSASNGSGKVLLVSDGQKNLTGMAFGYTDYPHDKFGYTGKEVTISYLKQDIRSNLGNFIRRNDQVLKQGLFGSVLSSAWPLLDPAVRQAKLEYIGIKKVEGKEFHALRYFPQKSSASEVKITLFFDKENFRHMRTEYYRLISTREEGSISSSPVQRDPRGAGSEAQIETRYNLIEEFDDFKTESGLMLPHKYSIHLWMGSVKNTWELTLSNFGFNEKIEESVFDVNKPIN